ncbi:MAG: hypothetical protein GXO04_05025 [Aquificae bacterium]|nr:hypothetical protein [Aquificota bacterium]
MFEKVKKVLSTLRGSLSGDSPHIPRKEIQSAIDLLEQIERDILEKELEAALEALEQLDENRKFFYLIGKLYVEVTKEEAKRLIELELKKLREE